MSHYQVILNNTHLNTVSKNFGRKVLKPDWRSIILCASNSMRKSEIATNKTKFIVCSSRPIANNHKNFIVIFFCNTT